MYGKEQGNKTTSALAFAVLSSSTSAIERSIAINGLNSPVLRSADFGRGCNFLGIRIETCSLLFAVNCSGVFSCLSSHNTRSYQLDEYRDDKLNNQSVDRIEALLLQPITRNVGCHYYRKCKSMSTNDSVHDWHGKLGTRGWVSSVLTMFKSRCSRQQGVVVQAPPDERDAEKVLDTFHPVADNGPAGSTSIISLLSPRSLVLIGAPPVRSKFHVGRKVQHLSCWLFPPSAANMTTAVQMQPTIEYHESLSLAPCLKRPEQDSSITTDVQ